LLLAAEALLVARAALGEQLSKLEKRVRSLARYPGENSTYSDVDMKTEPSVGYVHKDGTPYPKMTRRAPG